MLEKVFRYTLWMIKIVATRCYILKLKCTKFDFGCAPDPIAGSLVLSEGRGNACHIDFYDYFVLHAVDFGA